MADSIANYALNKAAWDPNDQQVTIDGIAVDDPGNDTKYSTSINNDTNSWAVQAGGDGVINRSHNGSGDFTVNISRMSDYWQYLLANKDDFLKQQHTIVGRSTTDVSTTNTAVLGRLPNTSAGNNADSLGLTFHCKSINVDGVKK